MSDQDNQAPQESQTPNVDQLLAEIQTPDGRQKFEEVEPALNALKHAQDHIPVIEGENKTLKETNELLMTKLERMEEMFTKVMQEKEKPAATPAESQTPASQPIDQDALLDKMETRLSQKQQAQAAEANKRKALEAAIEVYGDRTVEVMREKAAALGITEQALLKQAEQSPALFSNSMGLNTARKPSQALGQSSMNTATLKREEARKTMKVNPMLSGKMQDAVDLMKSLE